jgi:hypothetical protein
LVVVSIFFVLNAGAAVFSAIKGVPLAAACGVMGAFGALIGIVGHFSLRWYDAGKSN